jgi:5-formyltetrahydrofolate cyclo-ligase
MKSQLRNNFQAKLREIGLPEKENIEKGISSNLLQVLNSSFIGLKSIGLYWPLGDEFSLSWNDLNKWIISVPEIENDLINYKLVAIEEFVNRKHHYNDKLEGKVIIPDVIIIPALAFDRNGYRLGRGKGFFDKYLETYQGVKIGVCSEMQILEDIGQESHDLPVDYIVTEKQIYKVRRG